jgi:NTP pyrophosphatase (non-canonical NTP hydrolase)
MGMNQYQDLASRTAAPLDRERDRVMRGILGLCGETGELAEHFKKHYYQGHAWDRQRVRKEMGDILWYLAVLAEDLNTSLDLIARENIRKLTERYPEGFDAGRSQRK